MSGLTLIYMENAKNSVFVGVHPRFPRPPFGSLSVE